mgnify:CR=1 FL=1
MRNALYLLLFVVTLSCGTQKSLTYQADPELSNTFKTNFKDAAEQYRLLKQQLPEGKFPKTYFPETGKYEFSNSEWWCSGFYPGTLLYLYEETKDQDLLEEAQRMLKLLEKEKDNTSTHDLGFMMYCSFGHANRIDPNPKYRNILLESAKSLATRFDPQVGCIKSWDSKPEDFLVIIDNMMNLELLFWAARVLDDSSFYNMAVTHANTTLENHFRSDNSSYHVVNYDVQTGAVKEKRTAQGAADDSAWARGQAWGFYGYTVMYRETRQEKYLKQARKIAQFLLSHPNLPADKVPYWDFNASDIPDALRDASAAAIMASALIELSEYVTAQEATKYLQTAETILKTLSSSTYKAEKGTNGGFLLQHCVGHKPGDLEVDVPLTYADYYFVEAMQRYEKLSKR